MIVKRLKVQLFSVVNNLNLLLLLVFCLISSELYAESSSKISVSAGPSFNQQFIFYSSDYYQNRQTVGPGFSCSFDYTVSHPIKLLTNATYEYESYKDFFSYHDLKISANFIFKFFNNIETVSRVNLYLLTGYGVDFVFRNDGDFGLYFLIRDGFLLDFGITEKVTLYFKPIVELTFQKGSAVLHTSEGIGVSVNLGGKK